MALFSERYGYTKPSDVLIRETITEEIENALCSCYDVLEETLRRSCYSYNNETYKEMGLFLWTDFLNKRRNDFYGDYGGHMIVATRNKWKKAKPLDIPVDWKKIINSVRIDKNCSAGEMKAIQQACYNAGIDPVFKAAPVEGGIEVPAGAVQIVFESFDIDDMPGNMGIIIK